MKSRDDASRALEEAAEKKEKEVQRIPISALIGKPIDPWEGCDIGALILHCEGLVSKILDSKYEFIKRYDSRNNLSGINIVKKPLGVNALYNDFVVTPLTDTPGYRYGFKCSSSKYGIEILTTEGSFTVLPTGIYYLEIYKPWTKDIMGLRVGAQLRQITEQHPPLRLQAIPVAYGFGLLDHENRWLPDHHGSFFVSETEYFLSDFVGKRIERPNLDPMPKEGLGGVEWSVASASEVVENRSLLSDQKKRSITRNRIVSLLLALYIGTNGMSQSSCSSPLLRVRQAKEGIRGVSLGIRGPGRPRDCSLGLPQIRTCALNASGSSRCGISLSLTRLGRFAVTRW